MDFQFNSENLLRLLVVGVIIYLVYQCIFGNGGGWKEAYVQYGGEEGDEEGSEESGGGGSTVKTSWISKGYGYGYGDMNPADRMGDLVKEFGQPDVFDPKSGGGATWYILSLAGTPYERIEIRDEQIPHDKPKPHTDFLYSWYKVDVPDHLIGGLHKISKSISYDPLKKLMRARCHDMRPNVVTHWIVKNYAEGKLSIDEAVNMYGPMVLELFQDDQGNVKYRQLESEL